MINGIVRSFQNVLNQDSGGQVRCILLYFEEKQNTNYFDQSEAVKAPINLLMYRSFRNSSATKIHCFHIKCLYLPKYTAHTLLHIFAVVFMFCHICDMTFNCDDIWGAGDSADYSHWRFCLPHQMLFFFTENRLTSIFGWLFNDSPFAVLDWWRFHFIPHRRTPISPTEAPVLTTNLLPVVRYVPTFHPSVANELINFLLTLRCLTLHPGCNKTKEGNFDKKIR